jgi:hypothetical protein
MDSGASVNARLSSGIVTRPRAKRVRFKTPPAPIRGSPGGQRTFPEPASRSEGPADASAPRFAPVNRALVAGGIVPHSRVLPLPAKRRAVSGASGSPEAVLRINCGERPRWVELLRSGARVGRSGIGADPPIRRRSTNAEDCPEADFAPNLGKLGRLDLRSDWRDRKLRLDCYRRSCLRRLRVAAWVNGILFLSRPQHVGVPSTWLLGRSFQM